MNNSVPPKVRDILQKVVNGNLENFRISVHEGNKKGEGFLGQIFFVSLEDKAKGKQIHLAIKQAFSDENTREFNPIRNVYLNEIYFYTKIWPVLSKFQEEYLPPNHRNYIPRCLAEISEECYETIAFENLKYEGFVLHNKRKPLEYKCMEFIFETYGKFHAVSFAYKALFSEKFLEMTKGIVDVWDSVIEKQHFKYFISLTHKSCLDSIQPYVENEVFEKYKIYAENSMDMFTKGLTRGKYLTITHGDCWSNNMMFKYDNSGNVIDLRLLDFQLLKLASPVCDLSYCLYSSGTKEMFNNLDHFLKVYYNSLQESLREFGCNPEELYPFESMKTDWKKYFHVGLSLSLMVWRIKLTHDDEIRDLVDIANDGDKDFNQFFDSKYDQKTFNTIVTDIIQHLYDNECI